MGILLFLKIQNQQNKREFKQAISDVTTNNIKSMYKNKYYSLIPNMLQGEHVTKWSKKRDENCVQRTKCLALPLQI